MTLCIYCVLNGGVYANSVYVVLCMQNRCLPARSDFLLSRHLRIHPPLCPLHIGALGNLLKMVLFHATSATSHASPHCHPPPRSTWQGRKCEVLDPASAHDLSGCGRYRVHGVRARLQLPNLLPQGNVSPPGDHATLSMCCALRVVIGMHLGYVGRVRADLH